MVRIVSYLEKYRTVNDLHKIKYCLKILIGLIYRLSPMIPLVQVFKILTEIFTINRRFRH